MHKFLASYRNYIQRTSDHLSSFSGLLYLNVWLTTVVGETWGMPPEVWATLLCMKMKCSSFKSSWWVWFLLGRFWEALLFHYCLVQPLSCRKTQVIPGPPTLWTLLPMHKIAVQANHHFRHPKSIHKTSLEYLFDRYSQKSSSTTSSMAFASPPSSTWLSDLANIQCSLGSLLT